MPKPAKKSVKKPTTATKKSVKKPTTATKKSVKKPTTATKKPTAAVSTHAKNARWTDSSSTIIQLYNNPKYKKILMKMMCKTTRSVNIRYSDVQKTIDKYNSATSGSDAKIVDELGGMVRRPASMYNEKSNVSRAQRKWADVSQHMPSDLRIDAILDFGGNVGDSAHELGQILGLPKESVYVMDVDEWAGEKWVPRDDITFVHFDNMTKLPSNKIDVIFISHVMHHIDKKEYPKIMEMFDRVLTKNGVVILYEHNCRGDDAFAAIIDLEHLMYDIAAKKITYGRFGETFYADYYNIAQWRQIFSKYFVDYFTLEKQSLDRSFYMFLRRK
jgi:ubiquinone/menaquinone biosynthesis C-methylase UbiE